MCRQEIHSWRFLFPIFEKYTLFYDNNVVLLREMTKKGNSKAIKFLPV